jgi:putative chitinase
VIQITGRENYRELSRWAKFDFEAKPEALESPEWLGIGVIWYFLTRNDLLRYCMAGNIEMVTRRVNGGLNGYQDRLQWYDKTALAMLGFASVKEFQSKAGLAVDGISGPKTRLALHNALDALGKPAPKPAPAPVKETAKTEHDAPDVLKSPSLWQSLIIALVGIWKGR